MTHPVCAVILAAGMSSRLGIPKQLVMLDGEELLSRVIRQVCQYPFQTIRVVLGHKAEAILQRLECIDPRLEYVMNYDYLKGQSTSVRTGFQSLPNDNSAVMFFLGDQPFIQDETIQLVLTKGIVKLNETVEPFVLRPAYHGQTGHPVFFGHYHNLNFSSLSGDNGGRDLIQNIKTKSFISVNDSYILFDIDTALDLIAARSIIGGER